MSAWANTKLGRSTDLGALHLGLFLERKTGPYSTFHLSIYPRAGITIGGKTHTDRIAKLQIRAKTEFLAQLEAEHAAEKWFQRNIVALCAGGDVSPS